MTFMDPTYKQAVANADPENGIDDRFTARLVEIQDGVATVAVGNVIRHARSVSYSNADENLGISVIVKDSRGVVTHYAKVVDRISGNNDTDNAGAISKEVSTVKFRLPEGIDYGSTCLPTGTGIRTAISIPRFLTFPLRLPV